VIGSDNAHDIAAVRRRILWEIPGCERGPFVRVNRGRRNQIDDGPSGRQQRPKVMKNSSLPLTGNVVKGEGAQHQVERSCRELVEHVASHQAVVTCRVGDMRDSKHILGDIDS
jgi:hypothetical protein